MKALANGLFLVCVLLLASTMARGSTVLVLGNESMPWNGVVQGKPLGIVVEILNEAGKYGAPGFEFQLGLPWMRAQAEVLRRNGEPVALIPLSRTPERETRYRWIAELVPNQIRIATYAKATPPRTLDEARNLSVGLIRGHAAIEFLRRQGFSRIDDNAGDAEANIKKLLSGRVDAIADSRVVYRYHWRKIGALPEMLQEGPVVGNTIGIYIAAGPDFPAPLARKIADAIDVMRKNGKLQEIIDRWQ
ncbi:substrate-binding periplasmic protein [Propionivibrio dicarboxylicus]|uniref:Amino acid ABC transporter substrate-binding protein, PAAT family n=1 Tax=Propionivibrio dicarboxylicus TaxID=83767 RepID=A0A1G7VUI0_9RHOO|nr:transporter substrate-binding domain-containing protein [Propionivibrio dicarboxylicus]SDG63198.1 amino acid ABC transporter substrate-binding protein, PAAT family [Propionivibrio dicarboxylicus]